MKTVIDISAYPDLLKLEMIQYEVNAYVNVLEFLLNRKVDIQDPHYQHYEQEYIHSYFKLNQEKEKFTNFLNPLLPEDKRKKKNISWTVNFDTKEVTLDE